MPEFAVGQRVRVKLDPECPCYKVRQGRDYDGKIGTIGEIAETRRRGAFSAFGDEQNAMIVAHPHWVRFEEMVFPDVAGALFSPNELDPVTEGAEPTHEKPKREPVSGVVCATVLETRIEELEGKLAEVGKIGDVISAHEDYPIPDHATLRDRVEHALELAAHRAEQAEKKLAQVRYDQLVTLHAIALLGDTIPDAGNHHEKNARLRALLDIVRRETSKIECARKADEAARNDLADDIPF